MNTEHLKILAAGYITFATIITTLAMVMSLIEEPIGLIFFPLIIYLIGLIVELFNLREKAVKWLQ